jgi:hypothetical protein
MLEPPRRTSYKSSMSRRTVECVRVAALPLMVVVAGSWFALVQLVRGLARIGLAALFLASAPVVALLLFASAIRRLVHGGSIDDLYADIDSISRRRDEESEIREAILRIRRLVDARARDDGLDEDGAEGECAEDEATPHAVPPWGRDVALDASSIGPARADHRRASRRRNRP